MTVFNLPAKLKAIFVVAAAFLISAPAISADDVQGLGRLFIDAEQREKLEAVRRGTYKAETEEESRISNVRVNGVMIRSDGENVVWVNGESTLDGARIQGIRINPGTADRETYRVTVNIDGKRVGIKPGQNWSEGTGTIKDNY
ncbi:MAG: hypothetical protein JSW45_08550 [Thiotrichales bacterium]|nr:MAG: hypothetical protein JSW45_08550 [Thiotrichales bacterium]